MFQMISLLFRYGALMMLGITAGGILTGQFPLVESLPGIAFVVVVIGGLSRLCRMCFGEAYPRFLDTRKKRLIADLGVFLVCALRMAVTV
jgi:hypothetical protein